jgi:hypothetical protein
MWKKFKFDLPKKLPKTKKLERGGKNGIELGLKVGCDIEN